MNLLPPDPSSMRFRFYGSLTLLLAFASLLSAPLSAAPKIGVLLKGQSPFWSAAEKGTVDTAAQLGATVIAKAPASEADIDVQIQMLESLVAEGIDALIIAPGSNSALSGPVAAAAAKGIKIVTIDAPLDTDMPVFIATNHTDAGNAAGLHLASLVGPNDEVSILKHSPIPSATLLREVSAFAALHHVHPGIPIHRDIYSGTDAARQVGQAHLLLEQHPGTKGILASGTPGSMAMLKALQESGRAGSIKFVGFGFNLNATVAAALESGAMHGWVAQLPTEIGHRAVRAALALLEGKDVQEVIYCDFLIITKDNLHDPAVQALR